MYTHATMVYLIKFYPVPQVCVYKLLQLWRSTLGDVLFDNCFIQFYMSFFKTSLQQSGLSLWALTMPLGPPLHGAPSHFSSQFKRAQIAKEIEFAWGPRGSQSAPGLQRLCLVLSSAKMRLNSISHPSVAFSHKKRKKKNLANRKRKKKKVES